MLLLKMETSSSKWKRLVCNFIPGTRNHGLRDFVFNKLLCFIVMIVLNPSCFSLRIAEQIEIVFALSPETLSYFKANVI